MPVREVGRERWHLSTIDSPFEEQDHDVIDNVILAYQPPGQGLPNDRFIPGYIVIGKSVERRELPVSVHPLADRILHKRIEFGIFSTVAIECGRDARAPAQDFLGRPPMAFRALSG